MNDILKSILQFFSQKEAENQPVIHELIERSAAEQAQFQAWKQGETLRYLIDQFKERLNQRYVLNPDLPLQIDLIEGGKTGGFAFYFPNNLTLKAEDFTFFFDWLEEQVLKHGYRSYMSDAKVHTKKGEVIRLERHYLKPAFQFDESGQRVIQAYGNITIDQQIINDLPIMIRFMVHVYDDRQFTEAGNIHQLLRLIFEAD